MSQVPPSAASLRGAVDLSSLVNRAASPSGTAPAGASAAPGGPAAPGGAGVSVPSLLLDGTDATFSQILDLSNAVAVIVELWASWSDGSRILAPLMQKLILEYAGQFVLVRVETDSNPQLAAAFQAQSVPTVAAIIGGRPVALFEGAQPEQSIRDVLEQVVQLAAQNGVTGRALPADGQTAAEATDGAEPGEPVEEPLPPHHAEAFEAISQGDYKTAIAEYETAIVQNPRDALAVAGLAQVKLLDRLDGTVAADLRSAAAADPSDIDAQLAVADLDISGGHVEDAFDRILSLFAKADQAAKDRLRERMLELFEVVGLDDPRVTAARRRLTMLLY